MTHSPRGVIKRVYMNICMNIYKYKYKLQIKYVPTNYISWKIFKKKIILKLIQYIRVKTFADDCSKILFTKITFDNESTKFILYSDGTFWQSPPSSRYFGPLLNRTLSKPIHFSIEKTISASNLGDIPFISALLPTIFPTF